MIVDNEVSPNLLQFFNSLNDIAYSLLRSGEYRFSQRIYEIMLERICVLQNKKDIRVHKGSYYYYMCISLALQNNLHDSLKFNIFAYIEDTINTKRGNECDADKLPAYGILSKGFNFNSHNYKIIKEISYDKKGDLLQKVPNTIFDELLKKTGNSEDNLFSLCKSIPTTGPVRDYLFYYLTPKARVTLKNIIARALAKLKNIW